MTAPANITVSTTQSTGSIPVHYNPPTATDNRDGTLLPRCTPGTGTLFRVGQTTTVSCTATDAAGNSRTVTFTVRVNVTLLLVTVSTNTVSTSLSGFKPLSTTLLTLNSEPRVLGEVATDADGSADYRIDIPTDMPAGSHTITVIGTAPDGSPRLWIVPIVIGDDGSLIELRVGETNVVPPPPSPAAPAAPTAPTGTPSTTGLPETGSSPGTILLLALAFALIGSLVWLPSRRRRPEPTPR
jgi:LPXTG-motif cell wall-anchored protein